MVCSGCGFWAYDCLHNINLKMGVHMAIDISILFLIGVVLGFVLGVLIAIFDRG